MNSHRNPLHPALTVCMPIPLLTAATAGQSVIGSMDRLEALRIAQTAAGLPAALACCA